MQVVCLRSVMESSLVYCQSRLSIMEECVLWGKKHPPIGPRTNHDSPKTLQSWFLGSVGECILWCSILFPRTNTKYHEKIRANESIRLHGFLLSEKHNNVWKDRLHSYIFCTFCPVTKKQICSKERFCWTIWMQFYAPAQENIEYKVAEGCKLLSNIAF